jgi:hypothetical protein
MRETTKDGRVPMHGEVQPLERRQLCAANTGDVIPDHISLLEVQGPQGDTFVRVDTVYLSGSDWAPAFMRYLGDISPGSGSDAYGVLAWTAEGTMPLAPWINVDRISIRFLAFGGRTLVEREDLAVSGVNRPAYAFSGFRYDADTDTATWALDRPVANDRLLLDLNGDPPDGVREGVEGNYLGDFLQGGDFRLRLDILGGDAARDGQVNALDLATIKGRLNRSTTNPGDGTVNPYSILRDVTADGRINALDMAAVKQRLNTRLPDGEPGAVGAASDPPVLKPSFPTRELFGSEPILA